MAGQGDIFIFDLIFLSQRAMPRGLVINERYFVNVQISASKIRRAV